MDYETFGEHQASSTGIFDFMKYLPSAVIADGEFEFVTPSRAAKKHKAVSVLDIPDAISWADFGHLQESDHFYYMCTKYFSDGAVHKYFNPYDTPYEAFINYMNVLSDFMIRVDQALSSKEQE